ncbi:HNH endonuclease [Intestinibacter sp.]|uniref:HNH endonuclease n=1 Tax=Intestinibacter sp. TaxID=1965304 RepID=UPI003F146A13
MESKWIKEKEILEKLITDGVTYEEIGKRYNCTGNNIKKVARKLGIELPQRRKINPNETFNKGKTKHIPKKCPYCGKDILGKSEYCSTDCRTKYKRKIYIEKWKSGEYSGVIGKDDIALAIRDYIKSKYNNSCQICGWNKINPYTGLVPLNIHHIDGNCLNNKEDNLQLLCPNCHSLTENFGSRNKNCTRVDKRAR